MAPDLRSVSFSFHRDNFTENNIPQDGKIKKNFRRRLQDKFEKEQVDGIKNKETSERSWHNISLGQVSNDSKKVLRNGADKISKTFSSVRTTIGTISQKFKSSTRRRQRLEEQQSPCSAFKSQTPQSRSRNLLGRTPTKLYSPFGIESPRNAWDDKENQPPYEYGTPLGAKDKEEGRRNKLFRFTKVNGFCALR